jgi:hypothetical protein
MTSFDKLAALLSIPLGAILLGLGVVGLFAGSSAHFSLPPVLGALPFLAGWTLCVTSIRFWLRSNRERAAAGNRHEDARPSAMFLRFLHAHPEFRDAPEKLQWNGFHRWLDSAHSDEERTPPFP